MKNRNVYYILLILLFIYAASYQARYTERRIYQLVHANEFVREPFGLASFSALIEAVQPEAEQAGLRKDDYLLSVNGRPYTGTEVILDAISKARRGDLLAVTFRRTEADGQSKEEAATINLAPALASPFGVWDYILTVKLYVLLPLFCLLVGFFVTALRPRDPLAWLLLALLLSFGQVVARFEVSMWPEALQTPAILYYTFFESSWPIWMMLFGIYFPERLALDRRLPWLKWVLIVPLILFMIKDFAFAFGRYYDFAALAPINKMYRTFGLVEPLTGMAAVSVFFTALGFKMGTASSPDSRRRLRLLYFGTSIALLPGLVLVIAGLLRGGAFGAGLPGWFTVTALVLMFAFPLTLAYVIVVQRALDVGVVIRQGVQYTLARGGVAVLRFLIILAIILVMIWQVNQPDARVVENVTIIGVGLTLIFMMRRLGERLAAWIDRRFFREAYNAEQILSELSDKVRTMVETGPLLETVAERISTSLHVPRVALLLNEGGAYRPAHALGYEATPAVSFGESANVVERLKRENEPLRVYLDDDESWVNNTPGLDGERQMLESLETQLLLPLSVKEKMPGFISLGPKQSEEPYSSTDLRLLQYVATQTGLALENSQLTAAIASEVAQRERLNRELEIAREVQERLFPQKLPTISGLDYCGACRPALGVGGDYYDFLLLPNGTFGLAIGDVSGKGIAAALLMASLQASLRGQAIQGTDDLAELMSNVNNLVYDASSSNRYATFFYAQYDPSERRLTYVNAGHNSPVLLREKGGAWQTLRLEVGGAVVGLLREFPYQQATVTLEPGDLLLAFTDGISEAMNPSDEEWGEDCLIEAAKQCRGLSAADMIVRLVEQADRFAAGAKQHDDMTIVVVHVT